MSALGRVPKIGDVFERSGYRQVALTGTVRIDPLFAVEPPARAAANAVTFEPGARTTWHTHPLGQTVMARRDRDDGDDAHRYSGVIGRKGRRVDGTRHPRAL